MSKSKWQRLAETREQQLAKAVTEKRDLEADLERERNRHDQADQQLHDERKQHAATKWSRRRAELNLAQVEIKLASVGDMFREWINGGHGTVSAEEIASMRIARDDERRGDTPDQAARPKTQLPGELT